MSSNTVIKVENLSKAYQIGQFGTGTISRDIERWWTTRIRGKEDPFLIIGETNDRTSKGESNIVWSLKDINFEVQQGAALGIIGRNGAGKSTLLKVLSQVTNPTTGSVKLKGRIASLLEVGTGFHPELTGKENIYLNGAILGMRKHEIKRKLDEIIDFSGVERYIDTPVKRYSSGMYVRLAFAVAAHLESEILIVDEVLAVGDAEFQKKCLGKMGDISKGDGRTVIFVSHNMTSITSLCTEVIYMQNGNVKNSGAPSTIINEYLNSSSDSNSQKEWQTWNEPGDDVVRLKNVRLINKEGENINTLDFYSEGGVEFTYSVLKAGYCPIPNLHLFNDKGDMVFVAHESHNESLGRPGLYKTTMWIPSNLLNDGRYLAGIATSTLIPEKIHFYERDVIVFDVIEDMNKRTNHYRGTIPGVIRPNLKWETKRIL